MTNRCEYKQKGCGGCPLLGKAYAEQLAQKQRRVEKLLGKFGPVEPILGMETPWHYRNKAIATFGTDPRGRLILGIYARGTHRVVPVQGCRLQNESLNQVMEAVLAAAKACRWTAYDEDKGTGLVRHVLLRHSRTTGQVLVTLVTPTPQLPGSRNFITRLRALAPQVSGVVQNLNPRRTSAVLGTQEKLLWGRPAVKDTLCGQEFLISSRSFYQVNPVQTERLYALALNAAALTGKERVVDAYCGIGTIGLCAAPACGPGGGRGTEPGSGPGCGGQRQTQRGSQRTLLSGGRHPVADPAGRGRAKGRRDLPGPAPGGKHAGVLACRRRHAAQPHGVRELRPCHAGP